MGISLEKGGRIDLGKEAPGLNKIGIGLGWDENKSDTGSELIWMHHYSCSELMVKLCLKGILFFIII